MTNMDAAATPVMSLEEMLRFQMSLLKLVNPANADDTPRKPPVRAEANSAHEAIAQLVTKVTPRRGA